MPELRRILHKKSEWWETLLLLSGFLDLVDVFKKF